MTASPRNSGIGSETSPRGPPDRKSAPARLRHLLAGPPYNLCPSVRARRYDQPIDSTPPHIGTSAVVSPVPCGDEDRVGDHRHGGRRFDPAACRRGWGTRPARAARPTGGVTGALPDPRPRVRAASRAAGASVCSEGARWSRKGRRKAPPNAAARRSGCDRVSRARGRRVRGRRSASGTHSRHRSAGSAGIQRGYNPLSVALPRACVTASNPTSLRAPGLNSTAR